MPTLSRSPSLRWGSVFSFLFLFVVPGALDAQGPTPESPEVRAAVDRAVAFLETSRDDRLGGKALAGLALLKAGKPADHRAVQDALRAVQARIDPTTGTFSPDAAEIYTAGLCACFLIELDPVGHRREVDAVMRYLLQTQKPHGGWGYPHSESGDTSMTQYGVLATWEAMTSGIAVPQAHVERVTDWLLRTQDPSGGYGYQGVVAPRAELVAQGSVRPSLSAAGLGSLYICHDLLGFNLGSSRAGDKLPQALRRVNKPEIDTTRLRFESKMAEGPFNAAFARGNQWIAHRFREANQAGDDGGYTHYSLYAWERYCSFRELNEGRTDPSPPWYRSGVAFLRNTQGNNGSWQSQCGAVPDTAFGILFLVRGTRRSIEKSRSLGGGNMIGGRGLPKATDEVRIRDGQVLSLEEALEVDRLIDLVQNAEDPEYEDRLRLLGNLSPAEARALVSRRGGRLREMAGDASAAARLAAVRSLGQSGDLRQAPTLIYALTDPDDEVARAARDALRRISRRLDAVRLPDSPTEFEKAEAVAKWKAWYLEIYPDAEFLD